MVWVISSVTYSEPTGRSADFQVCCIVGFQTRKPSRRPPDVEVDDTSLYFRHRLLSERSADFSRFALLAAPVGLKVSPPGDSPTLFAQD